MSNLIITIIGIALAAVTALAGIFYGGQAWQNYQMSMQASQLIDNGQQIASAWQLWSQDNVGAKDLPDTNWCDANGASNLVPNYLSQMPVPPVLGTQFFMPSYMPWGANLAGTGESSWPCSNVNLGVLKTTNLKMLFYNWSVAQSNTDGITKADNLCMEINKRAINSLTTGQLSIGSNATAQQGGRFINLNTAQGKFGCNRFAVSSSGIASNEYLFFYRVFD